MYYSNKKSDRYNLFIGRWQPFHNAHKYIIDSYVNNGRKVCIAIMDTKVDRKNPYPAKLRYKMIYSVYKKQIKEKQVQVIIIPPINNICVGRKVGYTFVREPEFMEQISGTEIRKKKKYDDVPKEVRRILCKQKEK